MSFIYIPFIYISIALLISILVAGFLRTGDTKKRIVIIVSILIIIALFIFPGFFMALMFKNSFGG